MSTIVLGIKPMNAHDHGHTSAGLSDWGAYGARYFVSNSKVKGKPVLLESQGAQKIA